MKTILFFSISILLVLATTAFSQVAINHDSSAPATGSIFHVKGSGNNDFYIDDASGKVGIGTTTPGEKLSVVGATSIDGNLNMLNHGISNVITPTSPSDVSSKAYVDSTLNAMVAVDTAGYFLHWMNDSVYWWDWKTGIWSDTAWIAPIEIGVELDGNFLLFEISTHMRYAWSHQTGLWTGQYITFGSSWIGSNGNFLIWSIDSAYAWNYKTSIWTGLDIPMGSDKGESQGNFIITDDTQDIAWIWSRETSSWTSQSIPGMTGSNSSNGNFFIVAEDRLWAWSKETQAWTSYPWTISAGPGGSLP